MRSEWDARKPNDFDAVFADLGAGVIEEDQPYLILDRIDRRDAGREEVEAFCTELAFAELRRCLDNEMGDEFREIANKISANQDLTLLETTSGLRGGTELARILQTEGDRDFSRWQYELVKQYLTAVSARLGVKFKVIEHVVPG